MVRSNPTNNSCMRAWPHPRCTAAAHDDSTSTTLNVSLHTPRIPSTHTTQCVPFVLSISHINICSLRNKLHDNATLLHTTSPRIDILAITATCLDASFTDAALHIPDYIFYRRDRQTGRGSGVCFYVHESIRVQKSFSSSHLEALYLNVSDGACGQRPGRSMVFGCIYRPPDSPVNFWNELEDEVDDISSSMDMLPLLLGDFNVNVLNPPNISNHNRLQDFCDNAVFRNVIFSPTRLPSKTCIDLVLLTSLLPTGVTHSSPGVKSLDRLSDHCLISVSLHLPNWSI